MTIPEILEAIEMLQSVLNIVFSQGTDPAGYILHDHDLSLTNILVDVDWECSAKMVRYASSISRSYRSRAGAGAPGRRRS